MTVAITRTELDAAGFALCAPAGSSDVWWKVATATRANGRNFTVTFDR
jgi:hypothetical protein